MTPVSIFSHFSGIQLTNDQHAALADLQKFLTEDSRQVFILRGFAGTGKTTILSGLVQYAKQIERSVRCATPTGSASKVLSSKTGMVAKTLHASIYRIVSSTYDEATQSFQTLYEVGELAPTDGTLFIVDEASMIGDRPTEDNASSLFGSGNLLHDLFSFLRLKENTDTKLLFVGDPAQLPPVGSARSVALDAEYLSATFGFESMGAMLTEVVRYDNAILSTATKIRQAIESGAFVDFKPITGNEVAMVGNFKLNAAYFDVVRCLGDTVHSVALFNANKMVVNFNAKVRNHLLGHNGDVECGERLLVYSNNYACDFPLYNGEFLTVEQVGRRTSRTVSIRTKFKVTDSVFARATTMYSAEVTLNFLEMVLRNADGIAQRVQVLEDFLSYDAPSLPHEVMQALAVDLALRVKRSGIGKSEAERLFRDATISDPFFNALQVKFGYGMTCHKAQGSEWRNVFVSSWTPPTLGNSERYRWLYTAYSRATRRLVVEVQEEQKAFTRRYY